MQLILLRHGIAVEPEHWSGAEIDRPLTPEGRVQAQEVLLTLARSGKLGVDEIWSSPFARCQETAQIAAKVTSVAFHTVPALASGAELFSTVPRMQGPAEAWPERVLWVGHQPDLGNLVSRLTGAPYGRYALGRCGLARLTGEFAPGRMKLVWLVTAEEVLPRLS